MRMHCRAHRGLIESWVRDGCLAPKIVRLLERHAGIAVPVRTLRRFIAEELDEAAHAGTVRVVDPPPGQVLEIDFMEIGLVVLDGQKVKVYALVCVASVSRHMFVWPCLSTSQEDLIQGLEAAWAFFGGVFPVVLADNTSAIVKQANPLSPTFSDGWLEYTQARGFVMDQARVRRPQDKARVERSVRYVRGDCFVCERFVDLDHMRRHAQRWCQDVAGQRRHGTTRQQPLSHFVEIEQGLLLPAPTEPFDQPIWSTLKVGRDGVVCVAEALYSVPHALRGEKLRVRIDRTTVRMLHKGAVVKVHERVAKGVSRIDPDDLPPGTGELATRDAEGLVERASRHGEAVGEYATRLLDVAQPWTRMRHVYRLLGLCRSYGDERVDAVCRDALELDVVDVTRVARRLERNLDGAPVPPPPPTNNVIHARFGRDPSEYRVTRTEETP